MMTSLGLRLNSLVFLQQFAQTLRLEYQFRHISSL